MTGRESRGACGEHCGAQGKGKPAEPSEERRAGALGASRREQEDGARQHGEAKGLSHRQTAEGGTAESPEGDAGVPSLARAARGKRQGREERTPRSWRGGCAGRDRASIPWGSLDEQGEEREDMGGRGPMPGSLFHNARSQGTFRSRGETDELGALKAGL